MIQDVRPKAVSELFGTEPQLAFYNVPKYQREYVWRKSNWDALFDDLTEQESSDGHFLGTFICVNRQGDSTDAAELEVIDGQQRLTSLSLLLAAIYKVFLENKSDDDDEEVVADRLFLKRALVVEERARLSLQAARWNHDDFESVLNDATGLLPRAKKASYRGNRRIERAFIHFRQRIVERAEELSSTEYEAAKEVFAKAKRAILVKLEVKSFADAFVLFESLNNRGTPLTPVDLIKTTLLAKADKSKGFDAAFDAWESWIDDLGDDYATQERFFRQLFNAMKDEWNWSVKNAPIAQKSNLIRIYETLIDQSVSDLISKLNSATRVYATLTSFPTASAVVSGLDRALPNLVRAEGTTAHVLLMYLFLNREKLALSDNDLVSIIDLLTAFSVRRNLTNVPATYRLQRLFMEIISDLRADVSDVRGTILRRLSAESASDEQVLTALRGQIYEEGANVARYLLVRLAEAGMNKVSWHDLWERTRTSSGKEEYVWTIEHVLPQTPNLSDEWVQMLGGPDLAKDVQARVIDQLGNLTLSPYNSSLGKLSFIEKRDHSDANGLPNGYKNDLTLNSDLANRNDWNEDAIKARTRKLSDQVISLFPLA